MSDLCLMDFLGHICLLRAPINSAAALRAARPAACRLKCGASRRDGIGRSCLHRQ